MINTAKSDLLVSENLQEIFKKLEQDVERVAGRKMAMSLCIFNCEAGSRLNYIANTKDRENVKKVWLELIKGWEAGMPDVPAHKFQ